MRELGMLTQRSNYLSLVTFALASQFLNCESAFNQEETPVVLQVLQDCEIFAKVRFEL